MEGLGLIALCSAASKKKNVRASRLAGEGKSFNWYRIFEHLLGSVAASGRVVTWKEERFALCVDTVSRAVDECNIRARGSFGKNPKCIDDIRLRWANVLSNREAEPGKERRYAPLIHCSTSQKAEFARLIVVSDDDKCHASLAWLEIRTLDLPLGMSAMECPDWLLKSRGNCSGPSRNDAEHRTQTVR